MNLNTGISSRSPVPCLIRFTKPRVGCFQFYDPCGEPPVVGSLVSLSLAQASVLLPRKEHSRKDFASGHPRACALGAHSCKTLGRLLQWHPEAARVAGWFCFGILFLLLLLPNFTRAPASVGCTLSDAEPCVLLALFCFPASLLSSGKSIRRPYKKEIR